MDLSNLRDSLAEGWKSSTEALQNPRALTEQFQGLSQIKKIEMAVAGLVFLIAAGFLAWNWSFWSGPGAESEIHVSTASASTAKDATRPVSATNPKIPRTVMVFSGPAGRVEIAESATEHAIQFTPASDRGSNDVWTQWSDTRDGARRMILLAGIGVAEQRGWRLSSAAHLSAEQSRIEEGLRLELLGDVRNLEQSATEGSFESGAADRVFRTVEAYKKADDDAKPKAAAEVMDLGMKYARQLEAARQKAINEYASGVDKLLEVSQRAALKQAAAEFALSGGTTVAS